MHGSGRPPHRLNSALGAADHAKSFPSWHRKVEEKLHTTKIARCIIRPNSFSQNALTYFAPSIREQGAFYGAMGNARTSYVDVRDIAAVVAKALQGGEHDGKVYELNGPEALTHSQVAEKISHHTKVAARYVDIPEDAQRKAMLDQGMPDWQVTALLDLQRYTLAGRAGRWTRCLKIAGSASHQDGSVPCGSRQRVSSPGGQGLRETRAA